ncbi:MAG: hypothetical protein JW984_03100 [Deltaproteobacteria bacterium]|uniref:Uncharacterized protein n=1 Tax=Candidatus Zymogenus saltonus TaxID=2844893 RepID=A0A9D8KAP5_9DELT|nr:hypothetical protein [Candidatus Zymogenus saltonus]
MSNEVVAEIFKKIAAELIDELKEEIGNISAEDKKAIMEFLRTEAKKRFGFDIPKLSDDDDEKSFLGSLMSSDLVKGVAGDLIDIPDEEKDDLKDIIRKQILKRALK